MENLTVHLIETPEAFKELRNDWDELYAQSDHSNIFSSWDWMYTWWEVFKNISHRELFIVCLKSDDELVAIAPLQIEKTYPIALLQGKTLRFIGSSSKNEIMTEYSDFIVKSGFEEASIKHISDVLVENRKRWNFADFEFLKADALVLNCFNKPNAEISSQKIQYGVRYMVPKVSSSEEYQGLLKSRWSKSYIRKSRTIERDGESVIEGIEKTENIKAAFGTLADMHRERWQGKLKDCIFDKPEFEEFHQKILERLVPQKKADIKTLKLNDKPLASYYVFEDKGEVHYYQSGFFTEKSSRYSPLFVLLCEEIGEASSGAKVFDFMFDDNLSSYKKEQFAAVGMPMYGLKLSPQAYRLNLFKSLKLMLTKFRSYKSALETKLPSKEIFSKYLLSK